MKKKHDHVDVFLNDRPEDATVVHIIDQISPDTGKFDEHKCMIGWDTQDAASKAYLSNYDDGWKGLGAITTVSMPEFKKWVRSHDTKRPYSRHLVKSAYVDLETLLSRSELMGSRGRARRYDRPEPEGKDYDQIIFTDDPAEQQKLLESLRALGPQGWKLRDRPNGFLTASKDDIDLSVYPVSKRDRINRAWALIESGKSKDEAWAEVNNEDNMNKTAGGMPKVNYSAMARGAKPMARRAVGRARSLSRQFLANPRVSAGMGKLRSALDYSVIPALRGSSPAKRISRWGLAAAPVATSAVQGVQDFQERSAIPTSGLLPAAVEAGHLVRPGSNDTNFDRGVRQALIGNMARQVTRDPKKPPSWGDIAGLISAPGPKALTMLAATAGRKPADRMAANGYTAMRDAVVTDGLSPTLEQSTIAGRFRDNVTPTSPVARGAATLAAPLVSRGLSESVRDGGGLSTITPRQLAANLNFKPLNKLMEYSGRRVVDKAQQVAGRAAEYSPENNYGVDRPLMDIVRDATQVSGTINSTQDAIHAIQQLLQSNTED